MTFDPSMWVARAAFMGYRPMLVMNALPDGSDAMYTEEHDLTGTSEEHTALWSEYREHTAAIWDHLRPHAIELQQAA